MVPCSVLVTCYGLSSELHHLRFMVTFPYPYMNGKLHLGHAFSFTKVLNRPALPRNAVEPAHLDPVAQSVQPCSVLHSVDSVVTTHSHQAEFAARYKQLKG